MVVDGGFFTLHYVTPFVVETEFEVSETVDRALSRESTDNSANPVI